MTLTQAKRAARTLSLRQLRSLDEWVRELIVRAEAHAREEKPRGRQVVEERTLENKTYRLEGVRCGKEKCKCAGGKLHGPYWYSYTRVQGKVKSQYVGKQLPRGIKKASPELKG
jgi:hypothetical protein